MLPYHRRAILDVSEEDRMLFWHEMGMTAAENNVLDNFSLRQEAEIAGNPALLWAYDLGVKAQLYSD